VYQKGHTIQIGVPTPLHSLHTSN